MRAEGGLHDGGGQWVHALDQFFDRGLYFVIIGHQMLVEANIARRLPPARNRQSNVRILASKTKLGLVLFALH